jgi:hypothetical protein
MCAYHWLDVSNAWMSNNIQDLHSVDLSKPENPTLNSSYSTRWGLFELAVMWFSVKLKTQNMEHPALLSMPLLSRLLCQHFWAQIPLGLPPCVVDQRTTITTSKSDITCRSTLLHLEPLRYIETRWPSLDSASKCVPRVSLWHHCIDWPSFESINWTLCE